MPPTPSPLGTTLHAALTDLRVRLGDPVAPIAVLSPSAANGVFARQQLALAGNHIRVDFLTPDRLVRELGRTALARSGRSPQPAAWTHATVGDIVRTRAAADTLGRFGPILTQPGWTAALARAIDTLEAAGLSADDLEGIDLPDHRERLELLGLLLREVGARRHVDGLYTRADLCEAARNHASDTRWHGAILLGDGFLDRRTYDALRAWLSARPHAEVVVPPWHHLEPAPLGLLATQGHSRTTHVVPVGRNALGTLASATFGPPTAAARDDSVGFVRTPDDVRELAEATREVLRAVDAGTPLDRIAVVLPDPDHVVVLRSHFERAGIPATWLVGPPLRSTPAARFLLHLLELAAGDDSVPSWYELLRQPGLRLNLALGAQVTRGRGRWRRILARSGAVRDTVTIVRAVQAWAQTLHETDRDPEGNRLAAENLLRAMEGIAGAVDPLRTAATPGAHAHRWSELLRRWWTPSPDREQLLGVLGTWGPAGSGPDLPLVAALAQLREALAEQSVASEAALTDPAVRVLTPMSLLGGAFEHVVVTGLTEGRLPRRPSEDAVLPDDVLVALRPNAYIPTSRDRSAFESRRFAAVVGSCTGRLWLSAPATELLDERPLLPSSFLLDAATALLGRRASYRDLAALQERRGSRARPWPDAPDAALSGAEHRVASTAHAPREGLARLVHHPVGRQLVALHRALDRGEPSPHTGQLPADLLDLTALRGEPSTPWALAELVANPSGYLLREVLQVRRPTPLYGSSPELDAWWREQALVRAVASLDADPRTARGEALARWDLDVEAWRRWRVDLSDADIALARHLVVQALEAMGPSLPVGPRAMVSGRLATDLPWQLEAELGWVDGTTLAQVQRKKPARNRLARDATAAVLAAIAHGGIDTVEICTPSGFAGQPLTDAASTLLPRLRAATEAIRAGWFPPWTHTDVHLTADPTFDAETDL